MLHFLQAQRKATTLQGPNESTQGSQEEKRALSVLSEKLLQCIELLWDIQLLPRGITKALFGNILISGHLQYCQSQTRWCKINYYIGSCLQMSGALLRKLILTLCNLKINRNQHTISRLLVRVHWHSYWQLPWNSCTHRHTHCVYKPIIVGYLYPQQALKAHTDLHSCSRGPPLLWFGLITAVIISVLSEVCTCFPWDTQGCTSSTQPLPFLTSASGANLLRKLIKSITRGQKKKRILNCCFSKTQNHIKSVCVSILN